MYYNDQIAGASSSRDVLNTTQATASYGTASSASGSRQGAVAHQPGDENVPEQPGFFYLGEFILTDQFCLDTATNEELDRQCALFYGNDMDPAALNVGLYEAWDNALAEGVPLVPLPFNDVAMGGFRADTDVAAPPTQHAPGASLEAPDPFSILGIDDSSLREPSPFSFLPVRPASPRTRVSERAGFPPDIPDLAALTTASRSLDAWPGFSQAPSTTPPSIPTDEIARAPTPCLLAIDDSDVSTVAPHDFHPPDAEGHPATAPSNEDESKDSTEATRKRAPKRKRGERKNLPTLIPAEGRSVPTRRAARNARTGASSDAAAPMAEPEAGPPRKRRRLGELEDLEMTPKTRCGLDGCGTVHTAPDLAAAHAHFHTHFPTPASAAPRDADAAKAAPNGKKEKHVRDKGKGKGKDVRSKKGKGKAEQKSLTEDDEDENMLKCTFRTLAEVQCTRKFGQLQALQRHIEGEHYGWRYRCPGCGMRVARRDALGRHYKSSPGCRPLP